MNQIITPPYSPQAAGCQRQRSAGLDIVRCVAILFVIASHFFLNTPAHDAVFAGPSMFIQGMGRTLFFTNVPLFLILTGYLNLNKTISRRYYKGMGAVLVSYAAISLVTIGVRSGLLGEHLSPIQWALKITDFSAISYAWYIEMWIGLFLLTPFLNILWHNVATRRHKHVLILTLYALCAFPDMFNRYGVHLVPGYWELIYPCAFYFIGAYIREYRPKVNRLKLVLFILGCCLINPVFNTLFIKNHSMIQIVGDGNGIIGMPMAAALFLLLYDLNVGSRRLQGALASVSRRSLDMYLASYMFDIMAYGYLMKHIYVNQSQIGPWFLIVVPVVFMASYLFALSMHFCLRLLRLPTK